MKLIESAGARAVPILCDMSQEEVARRFKVGGLLRQPCAASELQLGNALGHAAAQGSRAPALGPSRPALTARPPPPLPLQAVNGILIPGGAQDLRPGQPFFDVVSQLVELAIEANDKGDFFPVSVCVCVGGGLGGAHTASCLLGW